MLWIAFWCKILFFDFVPNTYNEIAKAFWSLKWPLGKCHTTIVTGWPTFDVTEVPWMQSKHDRFEILRFGKVKRMILFSNLQFIHWKTTRGMFENGFLKRYLFWDLEKLSSPVSLRRRHFGRKEKGLEREEQREREREREGERETKRERERERRRMKECDCLKPKHLWSVWPDWAIYWTLGHFSKPFATIYLPKSPTFLGYFL